MYDEIETSLGTFYIESGSDSFYEKLSDLYAPSCWSSFSHPWGWTTALVSQFSTDIIISHKQMRKVN